MYPSHQKDENYLDAEEAEILLTFSKHSKIAIKNKTEFNLLCANP